MDEKNTIETRRPGDDDRYDNGLLLVLLSTITGTTYHPPHTRILLPFLPFITSSMITVLHNHR